MVQLLKHRSLIVLLILSAALFLNGLWSYKEFVRAESYFAMGARLMIERGDWLAPHAPDEELLNKPPLTYWLIGLSYKIGGPSYGTARLPSVIAALGLLALVYWFGFQRVGPRAGIIAASTLATSYLFLSFARMAMSDMLLTLFGAISILSFIALIRSNSVSSRRFALVPYITLGLGVLTKGPVVLALVLVPLAIELLIRKSREDARKLQPLMGLLVLGMCTVPYFALVYFRLGASPLRFFFIGENIERFMGSVYGWSQSPAGYEFAAFFADFGPWSLLIPAAIWLDWKHRPAARARRVLYLWLAWTIVLFSMSSFKLDYYLLPAMPAASLIVGETFGSPQRQNLWKPVLIACALMAVAIFSLQLVASHELNGFLPAQQLVASVPSGRTWLISSGAKEWADDVAFNLPPPHNVDQNRGSVESALLEILKSDAKTVALVREHEYVKFAATDPQLKILASGETYGHGGVTWKMLMHPQRERLLVVGYYY